MSVTYLCQKEKLTNMNQILNYNIDLRNADQVLDTDFKSDLIFADPPYGITNLQYDKSGFDIPAFWDFCRRWLAPTGVVVLTSVLKSGLKFIEQAPRGWFRYDLVWEKTTPTGFLNAKRQPLRNHELILIFSPVAKHVYNPQMTHGHTRKVSLARHKQGEESGVYGHANKTDYDSTDRYPKSVCVWKSDKQRSALHPNQKPVEMLRWIIRTYTNPGMMVLDPVAGSGTTGVAALLEGRDCVMMEKDEAYSQVAQSRIDDIINKIQDEEKTIQTV